VILIGVRGRRSKGKRGIGLGLGLGLNLLSELVKTGLMESIHDGENVSLFVALFV
jgi:hypothetical protein